MKFICQLGNGYMLATEGMSYMKRVFTGYPYPDLPKAQTEMMYDLYEQWGIPKDLEYFELNMYKIIEKINNKFDVKNKETLTSEEFWGSINRNSEIILVYRDARYNIDVYGVSYNAYERIRLAYSNSIYDSITINNLVNLSKYNFLFVPANDSALSSVLSGADDCIMDACGDIRYLVKMFGISNNDVFLDGETFFKVLVKCVVAVVDKPTFFNIGRLRFLGDQTPSQLIESREIFTYLYFVKYFDLIEGNIVDSKYFSYHWKHLRSNGRAGVCNIVSAMDTTRDAYKVVLDYIIDSYVKWFKEALISDTHWGFNVKKYNDTSILIKFDRPPLKGRYLKEKILYSGWFSEMGVSKVLDNGIVIDTRKFFGDEACILTEVLNQDSQNISCNGDEELLFALNSFNLDIDKKTLAKLRMISDSEILHTDFSRLNEILSPYQIIATGKGRIEISRDLEELHICAVDFLSWYDEFFKQILPIQDFVNKNKVELINAVLSNMYHTRLLHEIVNGSNFKIENLTYYNFDGKNLLFAFRQE